MFRRSLGSFGEIFFRNQRVFRAVRAVKKKKKKAPRHEPPNRNIRDKDETLLPRSEGWPPLAGLLTLGGSAVART